MKKIRQRVCQWWILGLVIQTLVLVAHAHEHEVIRKPIRNTIQNEDRTLEIVLPKAYDPESEEGYEVVYLIDAGWHMDLVPYVHEIARQAGQASPAIFVGIPNIEVNGESQRNRDLLPAQDADKFLEFITKDVIAHVEKHYRTNDRRILYGHSYGGIFATYAFLTHPEIFDAYLSMDAPYQGAKRMVLITAKERLGKFPCAGKSLWIVGIEGGQEKRGYNELKQLLEAQAPQELVWKMHFYPNETHQSVCLKGAYDGFRFLNQKQRNR
ncbi:MAG: alpha/beta hydrolase-fold protein [Akkermansiaceae bacterium]|nr:alpha/beta hydrolase-fold protein [Akkermansiaceae bacterium]